jgi:hypothetical protein
MSICHTWLLSFASLNKSLFEKLHKIQPMWAQSLQLRQQLVSVNYIIIITAVSYACYCHYLLVVRLTKGSILPTMIEKNDRPAHYRGLRVG